MAIIKQQGGFTLMEVLVAMVLLTVGLLGVANLTIGIIKGNSYSKNVTTATVVAQQQIEQAQRIGYTNANNLAGSATVSMGGTSFTRTTTVSDSTPAANMKTVIVSVSWNPGNYSMSLNTTIAQ
ncbi:MAG: type IV pilus modification PilV family protein [Candidatus Binatia bacterium]